MVLFLPTKLVEHPSAPSWASVLGLAQHVRAQDRLGDALVLHLARRSPTSLFASSAPGEKMRKVDGCKIHFARGEKSRG